MKGFGFGVVATLLAIAVGVFVVAELRSVPDRR